MLRHPSHYSTTPIPHSVRPPSCSMVPAQPACSQLLLAGCSTAALRTLQATRTAAACRNFASALMEFQDFSSQLQSAAALSALFTKSLLLKKFIKLFASIDAVSSKFCSQLLLADCSTAALRTLQATACRNFANALMEFQDMIFQKMVPQFSRSSLSQTLFLLPL